MIILKKNFVILPKNRNFAPRYEEKYHNMFVRDAVFVQLRRRVQQGL